MFRRDKMGLCLLSNSCMGLGTVSIIIAELAGLGIQWGTLFTPASTSDDFSLGNAFVMLIVDILLYMVVAW